MSNYGGPGNQSIISNYSTDWVSSYHNKLFWNIFNTGVINNYTDITVSDNSGIVIYDSSDILITWDNTEFGDIPLETNLNVTIELYKSNKLFYIINNNASNTGQYAWNIPTQIDMSGIFTLIIKGNTDSNYNYINKKYIIKPKLEKYLKLRNPLSLFISPNNQNSSNYSIKLKYDNLTQDLETRQVSQLKLKNQILKMDSTDNIILQIPDVYDKILYVIAEFNWIENNDKNAVEFTFSESSSQFEQITICKIYITPSGYIDLTKKDGDDYITITDNGLLRDQSISTISENINSFINVDTLNNIYNAGNEENNLPISNGELNIGLNSGKVDGYTSLDLCLKNGNLIDNLNSEYLGNSSGIYSPGNEINNIPLSNGILCEGLNVEFINGKSDVDFMSMQHKHPFDDVLDGDLYKKLKYVDSNGYATNESFLDSSFSINSISENTFIKDGKLKVVTGRFLGDYTTPNGQIVVGYGDNVFNSIPFIKIQTLSDNEYRYIENVNQGSYIFTTDDYEITETYDYVGKNVKLIIENSTNGLFSLTEDDIDNYEITAYVTNTTTLKDIIDAINDKSKMITAKLRYANENNFVSEIGTFTCSGGYIKNEGTYIRTFPTNISQSGFVLNWEVYRENEVFADKKLYKQSGIQQVFCNWMAIGYQ